MKYIDEFRNKNLVMRAFKKIKAIAPGGKINIMEVCGTHTHNVRRFGLDKLLPGNLRLISGPGCPVCVSPQGYIDSAIELAKDPNNIIITFGDMLRVPGTNSSLEKERAKGCRIRIVYSALDSLKAARDNPDKKVIFLAVGFETTAPTIALTIMAAQKERLKNISFFSSLKLIPPAMGFLIKDKRLKLDGFLCPGHVSSIIGTKPYAFISRKYKIPCCVTGFEPLDILEGVYIILRQIIQHRPGVANQYARAVKPQGNPRAQRIIKRVFETSDAYWRGLGKIPDSGLKIRNEFSQFDAKKIFRIKHTTHDTRHMTKCKCGEVLKGLITPAECPLFSKSCTPDNPVGPCMVSSEGACSAYYKYR